MNFDKQTTIYAQFSCVDIRLPAISAHNLRQLLVY